jgi:Putative MetA-pathway of phenol degradation
MARILSQLCALLAFSTPALAQQSAPPLSSNRPGISESEALLVTRAFQLESGFTFAEFGEEGERQRQVDFPEATLRFGLSPRLELFANGSNLVWNRTSSTGGASIAATHGTDLSLNAKLGLLSEDANRLTLSAAMGLSIPVGSEGESSDGYDPSLRLLWSKALPDDFGIAGNLNIASTTSDGRRDATGSASLGVGRPIAKSTSWFVELFGDFIKGDQAEWQLDGGVAIAATRDMQFDISAGRTLQSGPSAWFFAAGITLRHRR